MKVENFVLDYLRKTKNKILTTEVIKEAYVDTFHVGDSFLYVNSFLRLVEKSVIIGFDKFGAWLVTEEALKNRNLQEYGMYFVTYPLLLCNYYDSVYRYTTKGYEMSEIDWLKYKMQYDFLRKLKFEPCLEDTYYFKPYLGKSLFQIFWKSHLEKIVYSGICILFIVCLIYLIKNSG